MRTIKFRGRRIDNGEWVYGDLEIRRKTGVCLIHTYNDDDTYKKQFEIGQETVGLYTGLTDKNYREIYEGDIVKDERGKIGYVSWLQQECGFVIVWKKSDSRLGHRARGSGYEYDRSLEVIGNIYNDQDILEGGAK